MDKEAGKVFRRGNQPKCDGVKVQDRVAGTRQETGEEGKRVVCTGLVGSHGAHGEIFRAAGSEVCRPRPAAIRAALRKAMRTAFSLESELSGVYCVRSSVALTFNRSGPELGDSAIHKLSTLEGDARE